VISEAGNDAHPVVREKGITMSEPFIFINTCALKEGRAADFEKHFQKTVELVETREPRVLHFAAYINADGTEASIVQVHPDAESMGFHMQLVAQHVAESREFLDFTQMRIDVCGAPNEAVLERMRQLSGSGVRVSVKSPAGGFTRLSRRSEAPTGAEPFIFVNTYAIQEGKREEYEEAARNWFEWNEAEHPRLLHHEIYLTEDGAEVTNVQVHPDAASMELQMQLVADRHATWQEVLDWSTMRLLICGTPSDALLKGLRDVAGSGVPVSIKTPCGGFNRFPAR
jgi:heme-degrading monooxygenase HmoA